MDAPRGSVEFEGTEELQRLRGRAYGPDADIAGDVAAQARLSELEAAQRRELTPVVDAAARAPAAGSERVPVSEPVEGRRTTSTSVPHAVAASAGGSVTEHDPVEGPIADSDPINGPPAAPWPRRRRWLAILSVAIAALVLIAAGAWMSQLLADGSTPIPAETATAKMPPVPMRFPQGLLLPVPEYVLALTSVGADARMPDDPHRTLNSLGISADELKRYEDYQGPDVGSLNVWSGESRYGMTCLLVAVPGQGPREGLSAEGCSPEGFDTIAELPHLGSGGFIRFALRGDQVNVYLYERVANSGPSEG